MTDYDRKEPMTMPNMTDYDRLRSEYHRLGNEVDAAHDGALHHAYDGAAADRMVAAIEREYAAARNAFLSARSEVAAIDTGPDADWNCPHCGVLNPEVEDMSCPGFTGATIYVANYLCCGAQDFDASGDNAEAAR